MKVRINPAKAAIQEKKTNGMENYITGKKLSRFTLRNFKTILTDGHETRSLLILFQASTILLLENYFPVSL